MNDNTQKHEGLSPASIESLRLGGIISVADFEVIDPEILK